ncbi:hypothetical protein [Marinibactrum halimedae]|uniref:Uncharacterized protein n=1 Tax=Marinibactrum halimedae TaxID=1444977 RepID=A0AA37TBY1_9GAMM|nr:hypothetical protein [Marinibactrum halimedae]MCD9461374.1 hypothetical protein [Marinibactrum halimedae]GLS27235.1 hypothetical protein GCM10007877_29540 [Marinibactrum halimedae]
MAVAREGWKLVIDQYGVGRRLFVRAGDAPIYLKLIYEHHTSYHLTEIFRELFALTSFNKGVALTLDQSKRVIEKGGWMIEYYLHAGDVMINKMSYGDQFTGEVLDLPKIMRVQYSKESEDWNVLEGDGVVSIKKTVSGKHFIAVPGEFESPVDAARRMPEHIYNAYKKVGNLYKFVFLAR